MQHTEYREVSILDSDAQTLLQAFDAELDAETSSIHTIDLGTFESSGGVFWIAYQTGIPIACGAIRPINDSDAELKRMFVVPSIRRQGIGRELLTVIERRAIELGYRRILLETGDQHFPAIGLFSNAGYQEIERFGDYRESHRSRCFSKVL